MPQYRAGSGSTEVTMSGAIRDMAERAWKNTMPTASATTERALAWITADAVARWPVSRARKDHSRDEMVDVVRLTGPDTIEGIVRNDADYAYYIKTEQNGLAGKSPFQELIRKPLKAAEKIIARAVAEDLAALMDRGGR